MRKRLIVLVACALCLAASHAADTLRVMSARLIGPYPMAVPYTTSEKNMKAVAFSDQEYLTENRALAFRHATDGNIARGEAICAVDSLPTLRVLRFTLRTRSFVRAKLDLGKLKGAQIYMGDTEVTVGKDFSLRPGESTVNILCLTRPNDKDTFRVDVIGKSLDGVEVNATSDRLYMQHDMLLGLHYSSPKLSPTGKYLSYSIYDTKADGSTTYETFLKETKSGKVVAHYNVSTNISWMPRNDLLFTTRRDSRGRVLVTTDPATMQEAELAVGIPEGDFRMAPNGDYLLFLRQEEGRKEPDGTQRIIDPDDRIPGWRSRTAIFRYDIATGQMRRLTFGDRSMQLMDISEDGKNLLLAFSMMEPSRRPFSRTTYLKMDAYTGKVDTLLSDAEFVSGALFSPDCRELLVIGSPNAFGGIGSELAEGQIGNAYDLRLFLYNIASGQAKPLLPKFKPSVDRVFWAAGDGNIYFSAEDGYDKMLFRLNPNNLDVTRIETPITYVTSFGISAEEKHPRILMVGQSALRARDMYLVNAGEKKLEARKVGEIDFDSLVAGVRLPIHSEWSFRASRGDTIKGFYYLPADFEATRKYPMLVYYYGGCSPTGRYLESYYPHAAFANMGYVVLILEPSGATGFGQEFSARHVGTWGDESSDDIIEGVKAFCSEHPFVNAKRIGCMGASYGGFMTQYLQTKTDIFACAISHAGISDITAYWGGGYWGYTYGEAAEYGSFPWNNPDLFVKHSPLYNADKIHTPLLLLHGTVDTNVPTHQSQAMYTALRILDRPVAYVTFADQNHHVTDWKKRLAWQEIINAWLAMWLKDEPLWWNTLYPGDSFDKSKDK